MTTTESFLDCQVLVVGAGPTGLTLAAQLLARGIRTRLIDSAPGPALQSRAIGIQARTLELLDTMGLAEDFLARGHPVTHLCMYAGRRRLLNLSLADNGSQYPFVLHLPQSETEALLRARVRALGGVVEEGVELLRLRDRGEVVEATLRDGAGREIRVDAAYVVGCDGAHSRVRKELGVAFEGQPYPQDWLLADVALRGAGDPDAVHLFFRPDGLPLTCIPTVGYRWRVVMANVGDLGGRPPSFEQIQDLVAQRAPWPLEVSDPTWVTSFRCHLRSAPTYRHGRVFLAGDAAHIHSPAGGQGMNTGMMDAQNLAWKLALVAGGRAADDLLDTYGHERVPVASGVLGTTDRLVRLMTMHGSAKRAIRDAVLPVASSLPAVQRRMARRLSQVSVAYPAGPPVLSDGRRGSHAAGGGPRPGERAPDITVRTPSGTSRLYEQLRAGRHVLVADSADELAAFDVVGMVGDELVGTAIGRFGGWGVTLVRPDGVVAACSRAGAARYLQGMVPQGVPA
jgi:2-polyprenyl-6-methoxyphenol hydroxylase-like FAD-dependent oxidoreductase